MIPDPTGAYTEAMKVGERGQVILARKRPRKLKLNKWKGKCKDSFAELGSRSVDKFIEDIRGR
jgi:hypothetical protein